MSISRIKMVRHGMYGTRQWRIWSGMKRRCYSKNDPTYQRYGAKGITVCDKWRDSFMGFWNDMKKGYSDELQIDRKDNSKGYYKENCRWVTLKQQANNKKSVKLYTHNGKKMNMRAWDKELGFKGGTVRARIKERGWSIKKALTVEKIGKGYSFDKSRNKYIVEVGYNKKRYFVGRFDTGKEALKARNKFIKELC